MEIEERTEGTAVVVSLSGRLDGASGPDLEARIAAIVERGDVRVVLECGQMAYVSSAGLRVLLISARKCLEAGHRSPATRVSVGASKGVGSWPSQPCNPSVGRSWK